MKLATLSTVAALAVLMFGCSSPPTLNNLVADNGPERTLVMVDGADMLFSSVVWDAGLASETVIPGGFLSGYMFSVPPGASLGAHPVALRNTAGTSITKDFNVTAPLPFGAPRIDHVTLVFVNFGGGNVTPLLYVQGANFDVGAIVQIDGSDVATASHRGVHTQLYGTDPTVMGYPIYHYVSLLALPGTRPAGDSVSVAVRNLDGVTSAAEAYTLPASAAVLDSDGDNLLDSWELSGYDADSNGTVDVNLPLLGASPLQPDILVEVDVMNGLANPPVPSTPGNPGTFETAEAMFANAPVLNPFGQKGINLILDTSGTVPFNNVLEFGTIITGPPGTPDFADLKATNFDNATRDRIFHYSIWGNQLVGGYSGVSDVQFAMTSWCRSTTSQGSTRRFGPRSKPSPMSSATIWASDMAGIRIACTSRIIGASWPIRGSFARAKAMPSGEASRPALRYTGPMRRLSSRTAPRRPRRTPRPTIPTAWGRRSSRTIIRSMSRRAYAACLSIGTAISTRSMSISAWMPTTMAPPPKRSMTSAIGASSITKALRTTAI
jgi:hypothetical protein